MPPKLTPSQHNDSDDDTTAATPALTNVTPDSNFDSSLHINSYRARTRGASIRLSASLRALTDRQIMETLKSTNIGTEFKITYASAPDFNELQATCQVVAIAEGSKRLVKLHTRDGTQTLLLPCNDFVITHIDVIRRATLSVPISNSNCEPEHFSATIFLDGGSRPNPGPSAAGIVVRLPRSTAVAACNFEDVAHSRYYPYATNNIIEGIAMVAALRAAHRLIHKST